MTTLKTVHERQQKARDARWLVSETREEAYWALSARDRERVDLEKHPDVLAAKAAADKLDLEVARLHEEVGGKVYRVNDAKLDGLRERIEKLNKKAVKLGTDAVTLTVSDEHDQEIRRDEGRETIFDFTFVIVAGETPMLPGWVFIATLDHEADQGLDESVGIRRAPTGTFLASKIGAEAAEKVETADLSKYRHAAPNCDHCGYKRRRNRTYVLLEIATGELRQLGTDCVGDYTGANNPERVASWAEWLWALDSDLESTDDDGFGGGGESYGRAAIRTEDFLANVVALTREEGWVPRWRSDDYGFERNSHATADMAMANLFAKGKDKIGVVEEDYEAARTALDWVRDDLGERGDEHLNEFQHNLVTYCRSDWLPAKGDGYVAAAPGALTREIEGRIEKERTAASEWFGEVGSRVKGLTFKVTFTKTFEGRYGVTTLTKGYTAEGNGVVWWGAGGLDQGKTYSCSATIKGHETDTYNGGGKVTKISNVRTVKEIEDAAGAEMETVKTAAEREQDRLARLDPAAIAKRLDGAIASRDACQKTLDDDQARSADRYYYRDRVEMLGRVITALQSDLEALGGRPEPAPPVEPERAADAAEGTAEPEIRDLDTWRRGESTPKKGERVRLSKLSGYVVSQDRRGECRHGVCKCGECNGHSTTYEGTVSRTILWGDNSIEVEVFCDDGEYRSKEIDYPHGDACF